MIDLGFMSYIYLLVHHTHTKFKIEKSHNLNQSGAVLGRNYGECDFAASYEIECDELIIERFYSSLNFLFEGMYILDPSGNNKTAVYFNIACLKEMLSEINNVIVKRKQNNIALRKGISILENRTQYSQTQYPQASIKPSESEYDNNNWSDAEKFNNITLQELYEWLDYVDSNLAGTWKYNDNTYLVLNNLDEISKDKRRKLIPYSCLRVPDHSWDIFNGGFYNPKVAHVFLRIDEEKYDYLTNLCQTGQCPSPSLRVITNILTRLVNQSIALESCAKELKKNDLACIENENAFWNTMYGDFMH